MDNLNVSTAIGLDLDVENKDSDTKKLIGGEHPEDEPAEPLTEGDKTSHRWANSFMCVFIIAIIAVLSLVSVVALRWTLVEGNTMILHDGMNIEGDLLTQGQMTTTGTVNSDKWYKIHNCTAIRKIFFSPMFIFPDGLDILFGHEDTPYTRIEAGTAIGFRLTPTHHGSLVLLLSRHFIWAFRHVLLFHGVSGASDGRIKKEVQAIDGTTALNAILGLKPVTYEYEDAYLNEQDEYKQGERYAGFIAQEVETVIPNMVRKTNATIGNTNYDDFRFVQDKRFTPYQIAATKALHAELEALRTRVQTLEGGSP